MVHGKSAMSLLDSSSAGILCGANYSDGLLYLKEY